MMQRWVMLGVIVTHVFKAGMPMDGKLFVGNLISNPEVTLSVEVMGTFQDFVGGFLRVNAGGPKHVEGVLCLLEKVVP